MEQDTRKTKNSPAGSYGKKIIFPLLALLLLACGTTMVTILIDVRSFLSEGELLIDYGTNPVIPGNLPEASVQTPVEIIPLPEEINSITDIDAIEISAIIEFRNETGEASLTYRVFFDVNEENIFNTTPVINSTIILAPNTTHIDSILIEGNRRILSLFEEEEIAVASEIVIIPGGGTENIKGEVESTELTVLISAVGE